MWIDAHRDQFGIAPETGEVVVFDTDDTNSLWPLYRPPSVGQCATMFVPLLSAMDSLEYRYFKSGYIMKRVEIGKRVFNYIEFGDRTGWLEPF